jgi:hypothetical protein
MSDKAIKCWIWNDDATTGEHKTKRSDPEIVGRRDLLLEQTPDMSKQIGWMVLSAQTLIRSCVIRNIRHGRRTVWKTASLLDPTQRCGA